MRRSELVRRLSALEGFPRPEASREQVLTPPEAACELLESADHRGHLSARSVADLGCGTGILAIGAALLGASPVVGLEEDAGAVEVARRNSLRAGVSVDWRVGSVEGYAAPVDTVLMNPPFGAQRRHADRPFWRAAFDSARKAIYAFALRESRSFIGQRAVERSAPILETRPVRWVLPASFPHHRKPRREILVDLWVLGAPQPA